MISTLRIIAGLLILLGIQQPVFGCSCAPASADQEKAVLEAFDHASSVVLAIAESIENIALSRSQNPQEREDEITQFAALHSWKGSHGDTFYTKISLRCCACGIAFEVGKTYLLYLHGPYDEYYKTGICSRTRDESRSAEDIRIINSIATIKSKNSPAMPPGTH